MRFDDFLVSVLISFFVSFILSFAISILLFGGNSSNFQLLLLLSAVIFVGLMYLQIVVLKKVNYKKYLASPEWDKRRKQAYKDANYACQKCGAKNVTLEAHHLTYANLGNETPEDLLVVCRNCHQGLEFEKIIKP